MKKYLYNENGDEIARVEIGRSKTIDVTEYGYLGDTSCVCGAYSFDVKRKDKFRFKECDDAEMWSYLVHDYGFNFIRHRNY